jgi:hypothetical protein
MIRRVAPLALAALLSCQDYRFNPVGECIIQPGQVRIPVSGLSTADILFVIDSSFSMHPIQQSLSDNFGAFIDQLAQTQADRVSTGKPALDFYIAVTTSAVYANRATGTNCSGGTCNIASPAFGSPYSYACSPNGALCGDIVTQYQFTSGCTAGVGVAGSPYEAGSFVALGSNPRVLEFTKGLDWANYTTDPTIQGLITAFKQNVLVGDCGANQEMHFEGGRLAVQRALAGQQGLPGSVVWPHPDSKLVVVFVGNEDDCSTKRADQGGLVWTGSGGPGSDECASQALLPPGSSKLFPVSDYASFFAGLGRSLAAAFIRPGTVNNLTCDSGPGARFSALASALRSAGASVFEDGVCSADFATTLKNIADLVKPPDALTLPSQPASDVVTQLRLVGADGKTAYVCSAPAPPPTPGDWWFVDCGTGADLPAGSLSACIKLNSSGPCVPAAGQTLVAEYLGRVPANGCTVGALNAPSAECAAALGGVDTQWTCDGTGTVGTCLCRTGP